MSIRKDLKYKNYISLDDAIERKSYEHDIEIYEAIKAGRIDWIENKLKTDPFKKREDWGILSTNEHRNYTYHFVITAALIARFCIEGGLPLDEAYTISDYYIQKVDLTTRGEQIAELYKEMVMDYAYKMKNIETKNIYSLQIVKTIDYINNHLYENIKINDIADHINLNQFYLSTLFKQETGVNLKDFILKKKIETARNMIDYSGLSFIEIAEELGFCSQSYFILSFKKIIGMTPKKYQESVKQAFSKGIDPSVNPKKK